MRFSTVVSALIFSAATVSAAPGSTASAAMQSVNDSANAAMKQLEALGCSYLSKTIDCTF